MSIQQVKCRARVEVGGLSVATPYVLSFNVRKQRGQVGTFDASLKVNGESANGGMAGGQVKIYAGEGGVKLIFSGICRQAKVSPCYDDPKYVILTISGADVLSLLAGKKYTRRCRSSKAAWVGITGVVREGLKSGKFAYDKSGVIRTSGGSLKSGLITGFVGGSPYDNSSGSNAPAEDKPGNPHISVTVSNSAPVNSGGGE